MVEKLDYEPSSDEFFRRFLRPNKAVLLRGLATEWPLFRELKNNVETTAEDSVSCGFDRFLDLFGDCKPKDARVDDDNYGEEPRCVNNEGVSGKEEETIRELLSKPRSYLRDWHFQLECYDNPLSTYKLPPFLGGNPCFDWLQRAENSENSVKEVGDYRFLYAGREGSSTQLHVDVLGSYSWSANMSGKKLWALTPSNPTYEQYQSADACCDGWKGLFQGKKVKLQGKTDHINMAKKVLFPDLSIVSARMKKLKKK